MQLFIPHFDVGRNFGIDSIGDEIFVSKDHGLGARSRARSERDKSFFVGRKDVFGDAAFIFFGNFSDGLMAKPETI